ncbi:MAG: hypothetical protein PHE93_01780 [Clostridia bacterium]|nr:hypothetical protein [Clostridia bacterium]
MNKSFLVNCASDEYILFDGVMKTQSFRFDGDGGEHILSSFPIGGKKLPQSARICTAAPEFVGCLCVTKWADDFFELSFDKLEVECYQAPEAILQKQITERGLMHTATLFFDTKQRLLIENQYTSATFDMLAEMENPRIELVSISFGILIALFGKAGDKKELTVILAENNYKMLWQGIADDIRFFEGGFAVSTQLYDMLGRVKEESFSFQNDTRDYKMISRKFSYTNDRKYIPSLTQYLLLEALMCKDFERAQTYLAENVLAEDLAQYLGDFERIESPKLNGAKDTTAVILVREGNVLVARELKFEMKLGKIANISD